MPYEPLVEPRVRAQIEVVYQALVASVGVVKLIQLLVLPLAPFSSSMLQDRLYSRKKHMFSLDEKMD